MTNRDFDQSDAKALAEFYGFEYDYYVSLKQVRILDSHGNWQTWRPWSLYSEQWQIQSLLDAVREKGLERKFMAEIYEIHPIVSSNSREADFETLSAPPEAICSAILSMEGE